MADRTATLAVKFTADTSDAARGFDDVSSKAGGFQTGLNKASAAAAAGGLALVAFGKSAFDAASSAEQAAGAVDAAFGDSAGAIHRFAQDSADSVGLASGEYESLAAVFGAQLKNMGVAADDLAPMTNDLIGMGADLAAQFGGSTSDAVSALSSLLRGETDPIERYGVSIKGATIEAQKAEMGLSGLEGEADKAATTQATLALLTEQTASATGAFARESDTAAGAQQRANAKFEDAQATLGEALLPAVSAVSDVLAKLAGFVKDNSGAFQALGFVLAGIATTILAVKAATMAWQAAQLVAKGATMAWQAAQWLLNAAMTANPIGLIVVAVGSLIAGIVLLVKNFDKVKAAAKAVWDWIKKNWKKLLAILTGPFGLAVAAIIKYRDRIVDVIKKVLDVAKRVFRAIKDVAVAAFRTIRDVVQNVFEAVRGAIQRTIDVIRRIVGVIRGAFAAAWRAIRDVARAVFEGVRGAIQTTIDKVRNLIEWVRVRIGNAWRAMRDTAKTILGVVRDAIQWPIDKVQDLIDLIEGAASTCWDTMKSAADTALDLMLTPIEAVVDAVQWIIDKVQSLIDLIPSIDFPSPPSWMNPGNWFGRSAPAPAGRIRYAAPGVATRAGMGATSSNGAGVTINVNGALDPDAVARQIERILTARARRIGGVGRRAGVL